MSKPRVRFGDDGRLFCMSKHPTPKQLSARTREVRDPSDGVHGRIYRFERELNPRSGKMEWTCGELPHFHRTLKAARQWLWDHREVLD